MVTADRKKWGLLEGLQVKLLSWFGGYHRGDIRKFHWEGGKA
jgi:hypothetical protein